MRTHSFTRSIVCWRTAVLLGSAALLLLGCATPVQVQRSNPRDVQVELTSNVISTGALSSATEIVLRRQDLSERFARDPEAAIAQLHQTAMSGPPDPNLLFALAELSFRHAEDSGKQQYYLAAAIYAYAFLFPADPTLRPSGFDPRFRTASNLYNRGLTSGFASRDRTRVDLRSGRFALPYGDIDIAFDAHSARWGDLELSQFTPADELHITGLQNRYRRSGIGAPLAANASRAANGTGFQLTPELKVPVTALLRVDLSQAAFAAGHLQGRMEVDPAFEPGEVQIQGQSVPLEIDTTAAFAYSLSDPKIWATEIAGFRQGDLFDNEPQLLGLEPYRPGQIPVVFIHGTASSSGRWADLVNDLQSDPAIREHFQFWWFTYSTGNPTPFSALQLRTAIEDALKTIDPQHKDPALQNMVLIGHSQGGLLAKMMVVDSGSRIWDAVFSKPPDELNFSPQTRDLLKRGLFLKPLPEVRRVIFIATPQRGSFVAGSTIGQLLGRLVRLPVTVASAVGEVLTGNALGDAFKGGAPRFGSVWSMSPRNPALQALADTPVSPNVAAHSIIAVQGDGPIATGNDGVVAYQSAHIDEAASELVVRSGHSVQSNPHTVAEVRRILLLHLAETCPTGCGPADGQKRPAAGAAATPAPTP